MPSGHANFYGTILYCFPAVVKLTAASVLSNALLSRWWWDSLAIIHDWDLLFNGNRNEIGKWMHFYCLRTVKNYKDAFQLICVTEIKCFNNCLYFYYVDNGINFLTVAVDLSRVPPIIVEGQSHAKLSKEL